MAAPTSQVLDNSNSAKFAGVVTANDSTVLIATRGLYIGGAGNVNVTMEGDGTDVLFSGVPAGTVLPIRVTKVKATNTTATLIVALY
jgi:hypothetical protein